MKSVNKTTVTLGAVLATGLVAAALSASDMTMPVRWVSGGSNAAFDPDAHNDYTGNAPFLFRPAFDDGRSVGIMVKPTLGTLTKFPMLTACNVHLGEPDAPIPAGAKCMPVGYECSISTAQEAGDENEVGHGFGFSLQNRGGAMIDVLDAAVSIDDKPAHSYGVNVNYANNVRGGVQVGFTAQSTGKENCLAGLHVGGKWTHGLLLDGHDVSGAGQVYFAGADGKPTDYRIDGSYGDVLRVMGGGSGGGLVIYGAPGAGKPGLVRFRDNEVGDRDAARLDLSTGNLWIRGSLTVGDGSTLGR